MNEDILKGKWKQLKGDVQKEWGNLTDNDIDKVEGEVTKLLDTESDGVNTADFDYSSKDNLLFVPTFFDNRVKAYKLVK